MRSSFLAILVLLACLIPVHASEVTHLHIGVGNDFYTMGQGDNIDDGLSFGAHFMVAFQDRVFLKIDFLGFTDKVSTEHRYDQSNINLYSPLSFTLGPFISTFTPLMGMSIEGNFGFDKWQNNLHQMIDLPTLDLPYDNTETNAHLNLGSTIQAMLPLGWSKIGLEASYLHSFGWENSLQTLAVIKLGSALSLKAGYSFMDDFSEDPAHHTMMDRMSGPTFSYYFDGGLITNSWTYNTNSDSSYGVVGIDVMQLFQPVTYEHTDFTYSLGTFFDKGGHLNNTFSLAFGPVIWQIQNKDGPMKNDMENPKRRMTVASWMIGFQKEWESTNLVFPYLKGLWGFQRLHLQNSLNNDMIEEIKATVALEGGIKFGRDGQWVAKNNCYRPRLSASIQYVFDTKAIIAMDSAFARHVGPWIFLIGIGIEIGHDPHQRPGVSLVTNNDPPLSPTEKLNFPSPTL